MDSGLTPVENDEYIPSFALLTCASFIISIFAQDGQDSIWFASLSREALSSSMPAMYVPSNKPIHATPK
jgi:hypothetical protein